MAGHLADAICELAAPPHQPCFIRVQTFTYSDGWGVEIARHLLLLHVQPRALSAGLEVAVHSGLGEDEEGTGVRLQRHGAVYALPRSPGGLEAFAADLLATSPSEWDVDTCTHHVLLPLSPAEEITNQPGWDRVHLDLLQPGEVQAAAQQGDNGSLANVSLPEAHQMNGAAAFCSVTNNAAIYKERQKELKSQLAAHNAEAEGAGAAAAAAAAEQPDSEEVFQQKWRAMRDAAMAELTAALSAMLRQAARYRGTSELPLAAAPAAVAADGEQADAA